MAGRARPPSTETDPDLPPPPSAKKSRLSDSPNNSSSISNKTETEEQASKSNISDQPQAKKPEDTPLSIEVPKKTPSLGVDLSLESSEVLPLSDESFGDEEDKGKIQIGNNPSEQLAATSSFSTSSTSIQQQSQQSQQQQQAQQQQVEVMGKEGGAETTLLGENAYYQDLSLIGDGAYGTVYKAKDRASGQVVALKRIRVPLSNNGLPPYTVREIATLKKLNEFQHPQIVKLLDVCQGNYLQLVTRDGKSERINDGLTLWLVFEHIERDLASFISACRSRELSPALIKQMAKEIILGVDFLHSQRVIHRDLKPQNLLVTRDGHIKIADFGLAKTYDFEMRLTSVVVTLWYRAPEVLLRCTYASPIDIWSVGCILAELSELKPLFPGTSEGDQLDRIFRIIGTPPQEEWPEDVSLSWSAFPFRHSRPMETIIPNMCASGIDLIKSMLIFNPHKRITASQALQHPYFTTSDPR